MSSEKLIGSLLGDIGRGLMTGRKPGLDYPLNAELNSICHLQALLRAHHILHVFRIRVKLRLFSKSQKNIMNINNIDNQLDVTITAY